MKTLVTLVGTAYRGPAAVELLSLLPKGEPLELRRDPDNEHDSNAIKVFARGTCIGFVKATQNGKLAFRMDRNDMKKMPGKLEFDGTAFPMIEITGF